MYTGFDTCNNFYTFVLAKDKDRAVEIANEKIKTNTKKQMK
jgi:hypothetical protein